MRESSSGVGRMEPMDEKEQLLQEVVSATRRAQEARVALSEAAEARSAAYRGALEAGCSVAEIAKAAGVSRKMVYKVMANK